VLSFGSFSLHEQRKGTQGAGAEPPAISFSIAAKGGSTNTLTVASPLPSVDNAAMRRRENSTQAKGYNAVISTPWGMVCWRNALADVSFWSNNGRACATRLRRKSLPPASGVFHQP
jgi:hypothetical protein